MSELIGKLKYYVLDGETYFRHVIEITPVAWNVLTDAEFNRLAMEAPLFKRVVDALEHANAHYPLRFITDLLAEIAELEKQG